MAEAFYSYEDLCRLIPTLTADSTTLVTADEINPLVERFLVKCRASIQAIGGHSALLLTPKNTIAKISFKASDRRLEIEQEVFSLLERCPCLHIVRCYLSRPNIVLMPFIGSRTLHDRLIVGSDSPRPILS